jgi:hypothetical protein
MTNVSLFIVLLSLLMQHLKIRLNANLRTIANRSGGIIALQNHPHALQTMLKFQ